MKVSHLVGLFFTLGGALAGAVGCETRVDVISRDQAVVSAFGVPGDAAIQDLSDAEIGAWCSWYGSLFWESAPAESRPVGDDGTVVGYAGIGCSPGACVSNLSFEHCVASLKAVPCSATVDELNGCLQAILGDAGSGAGGGGGTSCVDAASACAPFTGDPACSGTIVATWDEEDGYCHVRVASPAP